MNLVFFVRSKREKIKSKLRQKDVYNEYRKPVKQKPEEKIKGQIYFPFYDTIILN